MNYQLVNTFKYTTGFTLLELLAVVTIIVVLTAVSSPFLGSIVARHQAESSGLQVLTSLKLCRVEALKRQTNISCDMSYSPTDQAVITRVYADNNNNNTYDTAGDTLIDESSIEDAGLLAMRPNTLQVKFRPWGDTVGAGLQNVKFCAGFNNDLVLYTTISIDQQGATFMKKIANDNCV